MNSPRTLRLARLLNSHQRLSVHVDPRTKKTYTYLERDQALLKYQGQENTFGSFTSIFKLGVNPGTTFNTPVGVYSYPIDYIIDKYDKDTGIFDVPFPLPPKQEFLNIFSVSDTSRCLRLDLGDWTQLNAFRNGKPRREIEIRIEGAEKAVTEIYNYYKENLNLASLEDSRRLFDWFNKGGGPWYLISQAYPDILDNTTANLVEYFFGIDTSAAYGSHHIPDFLKSERGVRFKEIVKSGVVPNPSGLLKDIENYYHKQILEDITFPYEDRFKPLFYREYSDDADYDDFRQEIVLAKGQRVVCDQAYVWNASRHLAELDPRKWTGYMRQMGFIGVLDYGTGTIHPNEETQAVFFDPPSLKLEETITNRVPQYEVEDKARLNISNWTRNQDEFEMVNKINYASAHTFLEIDKFIRELKDIHYKNKLNPLGEARQNLDHAYGYAGQVFKYLGWLASHMQIIENKPLWQEEVKLIVSRARVCREKLAPFINTVHSLKEELQLLDTVLARTIRNFGKWG